MKKVIFLLSLVSTLVNAQVYTEKQTRHRFAQLNFGIDLQMNSGGYTRFLNQNGELQKLNLGSYYRPRFVIGGTHFWGHADFYVAFSFLESKQSKMSQYLLYSSGVETVFKYYPWRIEFGKVRPFVGVGMTVYGFEQENSLMNQKGSLLNLVRYPFFSGITFNWKNQLLELGVSYNYQNQSSYFISPTVSTNINLPQLHFNISYRRQLETTLSSEKNWENGRSKKVTEYLAQRGELNNWFFGIGASSSFWLKESTYNLNHREFILKYPVTVLADFSLGYYWNNLDANLNLAYRGYESSQTAFDTEQLAKRKSIGLEFNKYMGDYHGFVPFVGVIGTYEFLNFKEVSTGQDQFNLKKNNLAYGLSFGWDIRPNRLQGFILRTNLRYFPQLNLEVPQKGKINFSNLEFNFIQLVIYPGRML